MNTHLNKPSAVQFQPTNLLQTKPIASGCNVEAPQVNFSLGTSVTPSFEIHPSGYIHQVSLYFYKWASALARALVTEHSLPSNLALKQKVAEIIPGFNPGCSNKSFERHLFSRLKNLATDNLYSESKIILGLEGLVSKLEKGELILAENSPAVSSETIYNENLKKPDYRNDPTLSPETNRAVCFLLQINSKEALSDPRTRTEIANLIPLAHQTSYVSALKHFRFRLIEADKNLPSYKLEAIAVGLEKIFNDLPAESVPPTLAKRKYTRRALGEKTEPDGQSLAIRKNAIDLVAEIYKSGSLLDSSSKIRAEIIALIPQAKEVNNKRIKAHLIAKIRDELYKLSPDQQQHVISRLTALKEQAQLLSLKAATLPSKAMVKSPKEQDKPETQVQKEKKETRAPKVKSISRTQAPVRPAMVIVTPFASDLEDGTPIDLALGFNFLGDKIYKALGLNIGEVPPIPSSLNADLLNSPCPFSTNSKIGETHILCLIPASLDNQGLSIISLIKTLDPKFNFGEAGNADNLFCAQAEFANFSPPQGHWVLFPRTIPKSNSFIDYEVANSRELLIASVLYNKVRNKSLLGNGVATCSDIFESAGKAKSITISLNPDFFNINTITTEYVGSGAFSYIGWGLKRKLI